MGLFSRFVDGIRTSKAVISLIWETSPGYMLYTTVLLMLSAFIPIGEAYAIKRIIDALTIGSPSIDFALVSSYIVVFIAITILGRLIENQRNSTQIILGNLFNKHLHHKIVEKTSNLPFALFEDAKFYDKLERTTNQATWKPLNTFYHLFDAVQNTILLLSIVAVIFSISPLIMLLMVLFSIPSLLVQVRYGNIWWNLLYKETPDSRRLNYYQHLMTNIHEMKDIKLLGLRQYLLTKYRSLYNKLFEEQRSVLRRRYTLELLTYLFSDIVFVLFYITIAWRTFIREITVGDFTFYSTIYQRGVGALHSLVRDVAGIYENNLFIKDLLDFFSLPEEESKSRGKTPVLRSGLEFRRVSFRYPGTTKWILRDVSFTLPLGKSIALVGENGAGKTTLIKLLTRLYTPTQGEILLNGVSIEKIPLDLYRKMFGVAFQDFAKFYMTVEENFRFGDIGRKMSNVEIRKIAQKMQMKKKIESLPQKYQTILGRWYHEGHELSQGEWQRIAIARALVKKAPIYVLDEPTAALDAKAEYTVFREFQKHVKGKTTIFISHRFSNVKLADRIIVLEHGKIVEEGNHKELVASRGKYWEFYNFQAKRYQDIP